MRIAICDDERQFITDFTAIVSRLYKSLDMIVDEFSSGAQLLHSFQRKPYDIVFLDIEMPEMDGIAVAEKLRQLSQDAAIVFLTGHVEYAIKGYGLNVLKYMTKPAREEEVREVLEHVLRKLNSGKYLWLKNSEGEHRVKVSDIIFLESQDKNVLFYTVSGSIEIRGRLSDYEKQLQADGFFRVHRRSVVSLSKVMQINKDFITVVGGYRLELARSKERAFREALASFVNKEAF